MPEKRKTGGREILFVSRPPVFHTCRRTRLVLHAYSLVISATA